MSGSSTFSSPNMDAPANNLPTSPSPSTLMDLPSPQELQDGNFVTVNENVECDDFEVDSFLLTALSNPRDRLTLLKLDTDLEKFIKDPRKTRQEFPPMSSYQRLIVHRVAQYFKLDHVVVEAEPGKRAVVLYKTSASRVPIIRLVDLVEQPETSSNNTKAVKIMRRSNGNSNNNERSVPTKPVIMEDSNKPPVLSNPTREDIKILQNPTFLPPQPEQNYNNNPDGKSDRSLEEREVNYAKARARIFGISEDTPLPEQPQQPIQPPPQVMPPPSTIPTPSSDPSKDSSTNGTSSTSRKPRNTVHMKYNEPLQDAHEYSRNLDDWRSSNAVPPNYMWAQPIAPVSAMNVPTAVPINYFDIQPQMNGSYQQRAPTGYPVATPHPTWDEFSNAYRMAYPSPYYPPMVSPHHFPPLPQYQQPQQPLRKSPQTSHKSTDPSRPPIKTTQYYAPVQTTKKPQQFSSQYPPQQYPPSNPKSDSSSSSTDQTSPTMTHKPSTTLPSSQPFVPRGYPQTYEDMWGYSQGAFRTYPTYPIDPSNQEKKLPKKEPPPSSVQFQQNPQFRSSSPSMSKVEQPPNDSSSSSSSVVDDTSSHVPRSPSHDSFFSIPSSTPNSQLTPSTTQQPMYNTPQISNPTTIVQDSTQMKTGPTLLSHILEIGNMKTTTMSTPEAETFLEELKQQGGLIKCLDNGTILVVFRSVGIASKAVQSIQQTCYSLKPWKVQVTNVVIGESSNTTPSTNPVDSLGNSVESLNIS